MRSTRWLALAGLLAPLAPAQDLLVCDLTNNAVMLVSRLDGTLLDPTFVDTTQGAGVGANPTEAFVVGDELWILMWNGGLFQVWSLDGETYLGEHGIGQSFTIGGAVGNGSVWVANRGTGGAGYGMALVEYDQRGSLRNVYPVTDAWDLCDYGGTLLAANFATGKVDRYAYDGTYLGVFYGSDDLTLPEQITRRASNGNVLVAGHASEAIHEVDGLGNQVRLITPGLGPVRGAFELANGNLLVSSTTGVYVWDDVAHQAFPVATGISTYYITRFDHAGPVGSRYCAPSNLNSTGHSAVLDAVGSDVALLSYLELTASLLPPDRFGYFLNADAQDFSPFPGGSQGNLCLGGSIGRHVEHVASTGADGTLTLPVDLTSLPTPTGPRQVQAGETWHWQCWFRDSNPGPTSNFTDAIRITFQ